MIFSVYWSHQSTQNYTLWVVEDIFLEEILSDNQNTTTTTTTTNNNNDNDKYTTTTTTTTTNII